MPSPTRSGAALQPYYSVAQSVNNVPGADRTKAVRQGRPGTGQPDTGVCLVRASCAVRTASTAGGAGVSSLDTGDSRIAAACRLSRDTRRARPTDPVIRGDTQRDAVSISSTGLAAAPRLVRKHVPDGRRPAYGADRDLRGHRAGSPCVIGCGWSGVVGIGSFALAGLLRALAQRGQPVSHPAESVKAKASVGVYDCYTCPMMSRRRITRLPRTNR